MLPSVASAQPRAADAEAGYECRTYALPLAQRALSAALARAEKAEGELSLARQTVPLPAPAAPAPEVQGMGWKTYAVLGVLSLLGQLATEEGVRRWAGW
jgi:hypothetical protein